MKYKKIIVYGLTASGKTTLANKISKILKIKVYCTDDFAYKKKWALKATEEEFKKKLKKVLKNKKWIIEGVHVRWLEDAIKKADLIVFTNPPKRIMASRALKRSKKEGSLKQKLKLLYWVYRWGPLWYRKYKKVPRKFVELKNKKNISSFLDNLTK